jgi:hypothetical protein
MSYIYDISSLRVNPYIIIHPYININPYINT